MVPLLESINVCLKTDYSHLSLCLLYKTKIEVAKMLFSVLCHFCISSGLTLEISQTVYRYSLLVSISVLLLFSFSFSTFLVFGFGQQIKLTYVSF